MAPVWGLITRDYLIERVLGAGVHHLYHDVGMQEVGRDHVWHERCALILEHYGHNVISYVPLPLEL